MVKSKLHPDFLNDNPELKPLIEKILNDLFLTPSHAPWEGGKGVVLTADAPYVPETVTINVHRKSYLRNNFGRDSKSKQGVSIPGAVQRFAYGTGCGRTTHGIPDRSVAISRR